ncbi:MAG: VWA domain-containing protein [Kiritimatiellae bacterium]|nr:VWA domain-containing protein [Kiritimatiellia bacterium]MDD4622934.1 VWA domain-containing protein [Kiritimatiellia bacterium]
MRFVYPWLLLLLSIVPLLGVVWLWLFRRARLRLSLLVSPAMRSRLMPKDRALRFYAQFALVMAGLAFLLFAVARPQWGRRDEKVMTRGRNLVIALDVSRSMLARDVHPNRLERAKTDIMDLIEDLKGDRAALLVFRNKGSLVCPLTTDYAFLRQALDGATPESAPRGETDLGDAIRKSLEALDPALDEYNAILLISDGEDLKGDALESAREAARRNIPIFTVGIGDTAGATIPDTDGQGVQKHKGAAVQTRLTAETLAAIANASNGRYIPLGTAGTAHTTLGAIYRRHLRQLAAKEQQEMIENRYQERYQLFLFPAILCILAAACLSRGRLRGQTSRNLSTTAAAVSLLTAITLHAQPAPKTPDPQLSTLNAQRSTHNAQPANHNSQLLTPDSAAVPQSPATNRAPVVVAPGRAGARAAQRLLRKGKPAEAAEAFLSAARGADKEEAESYRYNAACAYWQAKDNETAMQQLRSLLTSQTYGARAGELLGKLLLEKAKADMTEQPAEGIAALEVSASAFQRALRDAPQDERRQRNLTRAVDPLPQARENAHIAKVMEKHGQTPPDSLMDRMLKEQRAIAEAAAGVFTNDAQELISQSESLASRQKELSDLWIPLKQQMLQAVTNQQQQALFANRIELARDSMKGTAQALQDLLPESASEAERLEPLVYPFWQAVAMPPSLIDEDIICQSNAVQSVNAQNLMGRDTQTEAFALTGLFRQRFPQWAQQYLQQAQSDTNMPPFTAEDQARIEDIAEHTEKLQREIVELKPSETERRSLQAQALANLLEIRELLPKNPNQNQQQQQQQEQQQQEQEQQEQEQQPEPEQEKEQEQKEQPEDQKPETPQDAQETLRRALEREKEHERDKKERMRKIPIAPGERDW